MDLTNYIHTTEIKAHDLFKDVALRGQLRAEHIGIEHHLLMGHLSAGPLIESRSLTPDVFKGYLALVLRDMV